jgi:hypothetical protein
MRHIKEVSKGP